MNTADLVAGVKRCGVSVLQAYTAYRLGGQISELLYSPATYGIDLSAKDMIKPRAR